MSERRPAVPRPAVVVLGGSTTGMLAAAAASAFADVTVLEHDELPEGAEPRKGLPQARHAHVIWSGGVKAMNRILPGISDDVVGAGASRIPVMTDLVSLSPPGAWFGRHERPRHYILACSRDLLDARIRAHVRKLPFVTIRQRATVLALEGTAAQVVGVRARVRQAEEIIRADLVIDATGRASRAPAWLEALGLPAVEERSVDSGVGYATRIYRAPAAAREFPVVNVQADPRSGRPGQGGILVPIEGGRWLVTLAGTRGGRPTAVADAFVPFARGLRHPVIGDLLAEAEPLTDVAVSHSTANRRRFFEKARRWPEGFAILGDAVATYNPVYGHGLPVAAKSVLAMRRVLSKFGVRGAGTARRVQRAVAGPVGDAWSLATGQDIFYPGAADKPPTLMERAMARYLDRVVTVGAGNRRVMLSVLDVMTMEAAPTRLFGPGILLAAAMGARAPALQGPPLTERERAVGGLSAGPTENTPA